MRYFTGLYVLLIAFLILRFFTGQAYALQTSSLFPISDGFYTQWTPKLVGSHYTMVDETPCNGLTDYNKTTTVGDKDSYGISLSSIPDGGIIRQIDITPCASKNSSGGLSSLFDVFYRLDSSDSAFLGSYSLTGTTPATLSATSFTGLSTIKTSSTSLEIGGRFTSGNRGVRLSNISVQLTYDPPASPSVMTNDATRIASHAATFNSTVNPQGSSTNVYYRFGTSFTSCNTLPTITLSTNIGSGITDVSPNAQTIASLLSGTTYYFCAVASNSAGTAFGNVLSFITP